MSFLTDYFGITEGKTEQKVCCPFDHLTANGIPYKESRPSAYVNTVNNLFYCHACGIGLNEQDFIRKILGCSVLDAKRIQTQFLTDEDITNWKTDVSISEETEHLVEQLGFSKEVCKDVHIGSDPRIKREHIVYPVFMYGHLMDIRTYTPGGTPKVVSRKGSISGLVIPFDSWITNKKSTILCAGEKDMMITRSQGFNAITLTGGEQMVPKQLEAFRNKCVYICYDNDDAGITGAKKIANILVDYAAEVRVVTNFHEVCCEKGEDLYDYFVKYKKKRQDLVECIKNTPVFEKTKIESTLPLVDLFTASKPEFLGHTMRSNIQVVAVTDTTFTVPTALTLKKVKLTGDGTRDNLALNETREWELTENNLADILHLIDNNFKESDIANNLKSLLKIPKQEIGLVKTVISSQTVYKAVVTDLFETTDDNVLPMEFTAYGVGTNFESGKKYTATYKLVPHPYKGQAIVMIVTDLQEASDSVTDFKVGDKEKELLKQFSELKGNIVDKMNLMAEKVKGLLGYNGNNQLIQTIDLGFHSALTFNLGKFKNERGYLDILIVGESRTGKSSTADKLRKTYGLGTFISLAGSSATIPGIIGGSNKTSGGSYQTRAGAIPQNHKGLIIFEEFGKCDRNIVANLTDIRSSNEVRIARVSGTITMPALVRMISLTNVKNTDGMIRSIASYPDGISIVQELVQTAEDIARYDLILILSDTGNTIIDPLWEAPEPFSEEAYRTRIRWVWSRKAEDIIIEEKSVKLLIDVANALNKEFDSHIKIFGTECWKKVLRLAIAVAGYLVSTDETFTKIVVKPEHINYAEVFLRQMYDNPTFRFKEYVQNEQRYSKLTEEDLVELQELLQKAPGLLLELEHQSYVSRSMLTATAGLSPEELSRVLNRLARGMFIRYNSTLICPTEKFRIGMTKVDRNIAVQRVLV